MQRFCAMVLVAALLTLGVGGVVAPVATVAVATAGEGGD